ncbi:MAG: hypothetical protein AzoDbin1_01115 [Azoarcus sp.]|uniref:DUF3299 domain-containing protein n=1 Tax=Aromatoleum tolulyticum TaxID=34027 RepID=A0A1N6N5R6_9RHOO|nr:hypothetical protein [Aromatoleum tolulyticum]MCK9984643.1 hypothetical protein [Azoarcus sp.]SIP87424.1 hypothetical protein SAMN05421829_101106 [Aromatoleum tolulyticum]
MTRKTFRSLRTLGLLGAALALLAACGKTEPPAIAFAPYATDYASKPDFAQLEHQFPLTPADLAKITPENLALLNQEQLDQIYARLTAGPIPDGPFDGSIILPEGESGKLRAGEIVGGLAGFALHLKGIAVDKIGETLWKGKVFYRNERVLRNRIEDLEIFRKAGLVEGEPQKITVGRKDAWLLFPAKLYCGQSLVDSRRESVIIDYAFTDELPGYQEKPDFLAGRRGLKVRDEIRMVRPGLYLGRAYMDRVFVLNFVLYNKEIAERDGPAFQKAGTVQEDCWGGTQKRVVVAAK